MLPVDDARSSHVDGGRLAARLVAKYPGRITGNLLLPGQQGRYAPMPDDVPAALAEALRARGIDRLYSHQAEAWAATQAGRHVVVATPTAPGKSLCYTLPVLSAAITARGKAQASKSLFLFPTKALAQDQVAELLELNAAGGLGLRAATFDGDTPGDARQAIRVSGDIVGRLVNEVAGLGGACIVDEDSDAGVTAQTGLDGGQIVRLGEIGGENIDRDLVLFAQPSGKGFQSCFVAGNQHEVVAAACETFGVDGADARRRASNEYCGRSGHGWVLLLRGGD